MKIRTRLSIYFTLVAGFILVAFSVSIYFFASQNRQERFYKKLENRALTEARLLIVVKEVDSVLLKIIDRNTINELFEEEIVIYDENNLPIYRNFDKDTLFLSSEDINKIRKNSNFRTTIHSKELIGLIYPYKNKSYVVTATAFDKYGLNYLENLKWILIAGLITSFIITLISSYFYAERALAPIKKVINQVEKITAQKLDLRVDEGNGSDEIARLAITFNKMLNKLQLSFETQKMFLASASHELRTPLTSIFGQIEVVLMKEREKEEYKEILTSVLDEIKSLSSLTNSLLEISQTSVDLADTRQSQVRLDEILLSVHDEIRRKFKNEEINIDFEQLPENFETITVKGNENLLKIAFRNVIDNACKYSEGKMVKVTIGFNSNFTIITVSDNGIGISEKEKEFIFNEFYRAPNAKIFRGQGIGLSIVKKIIEMHEGYIEINSKVNEGTSFVIYLPHI